MGAPHASLYERLWRRVERRPSGCWEWTGGVVGRPGAKYGKIDNGFGKMVGAHRVAWEFDNGVELPAHLIVLHSCDNPPCCNPRHLRAGTHRENARDRSERNRYANFAGARNPNARLTSVQVAEIRSRYIREYRLMYGSRYRSNSRELGTQYGVDPRHVNAIAAGRTRHVG